MLTEKYDFRITDQMTIPLRPHWIANDSYREKCKMLVLNRSKGEIHKVDFSKVTDYIKEGDVICFNDSTIINHMFICKTRQNRLIKIVLEGFLPNNRVIISGLLKERLNANDVFYLVDNPGISIKVEQKFSEDSQYRAVVENHEALICYLASHGERLDEYVDSSLFYKYPDAYRSVFSKKYGSLEMNLHQPKTTHMVLTGQFAGVDLLMKAYASEHIQSCKFDMFGDCMLIIQDEG